MSSAVTGSPAAFGTAAIIGKREVQEDSIGWSTDRLDAKGELPALAIIADGMGGHAAGEVASRIAVESFLEAYGREDARATTVLIEALDWANGQIAGHVAEHPETDGMGCTLVAVEINPESTAYRWISVGDSLLLSVTPSGIERLNADHSYREERERLAAAGESLDGAPAANVLRSALMGFDVPLIDDHAEWRSFAPGETLILATDGLETLTLDQIRDITRTSEGATELANALVTAVDAIDKPRQDNTSVAVIRPLAFRIATQPPIATADPSEPRTTPAPSARPPAAAQSSAETVDEEAPTLPPSAVAKSEAAEEEAATLPPPPPPPATAKPADPRPLPRGNGPATKTPASAVAGPSATKRSGLPLALMLVIGLVLGALVAWALFGRQPATPAPSAAEQAANPSASPAPAKNSVPNAAPAAEADAPAVKQANPPKPKQAEAPARKSAPTDAKVKSKAAPADTPAQERAADEEE